MSAEAAAKKPKEIKRGKLSLERKHNLYGYIFVLPVIIGLAFIYIPVIIQSFIYSVSEIKVDASGFHTIFVGLDNYYEALFVEADFLRTVVESTLGILVQIPIILIFAFFMANVLNQNFLFQHFILNNLKSPVCSFTLHMRIYRIEQIRNVIGY